jgi:hypothetical protein
VTPSRLRSQVSRNFVDDGRRKAERGLVEPNQLRRAHQASAIAGIRRRTGFPAAAGTLGKRCSRKTFSAWPRPLATESCHLNEVLAVYAKIPSNRILNAIRAVSDVLIRGRQTIFGEKGKQQSICERDSHLNYGPPGTLVATTSLWSSLGLLATSVKGAVRLRARWRPENTMEDLLPWDLSVTPSF